MTEYVIGDIHGRYNALEQCLELSQFDEKNDTLILLGDIVDGGRQTYEVIERLLTLNTKFVLGNHDSWFINYIKNSVELPIWTSQGGINTLYSYQKNNKGVIPDSHKEFLFNHLPYYECSNGNPNKISYIFVHGGFDPLKPIHEQPIEKLLWDRSLPEFAKKQFIPNYKKVFIGHTTTQYLNSTTPVKLNNLIMMDTGAGWSGRLSIMNIRTEEYWQSKKQKPSRSNGGYW
jgi:serine/threonine protein phosphatase 1